MLAYKLLIIQKHGGAQLRGKVWAELEAAESNCSMKIKEVKAGAKADKGYGDGAGKRLEHTWTHTRLPFF